MGYKVNAQLEESDYVKAVHRFYRSNDHCLHFSDLISQQNE
jgi:hypothetical protein